MRTFLGLVVGVLALSVVSASVVHTEAFKTHLTKLDTSAKTLEQCLVKVTHPLSETSRFGDDVKMLDDLIDKLEGRLSSTVDIIDAVMVIPYVGAFAAPVLAPVSSVLTTIDKGLKTVTKEIDHVVHTVRGWLSPLKTIQHDVDVLNIKINQVLAVVEKARKETQKIETCVEKLPAGTVRTHAESGMEHVTAAIDHVPVALLSPVSHVTHGCTTVESFLHKIHIVRRKRGLPSLSKAINVLKHIDGAFGPLGHFLDEIHGALDKKICLIGEIIKIGKEIVHVGKEVIEGVEHVGKEVIKGAEHVGKEIGTGAEHVGKEIAKGTVNAGKEIAHVAEHVATGVKDAVHTVGHFFHHIFGRRATRAIDGRYYVIVDKHVNTRKRGFDICLSIHDALKVVNGVTGGMLSEAQKFIGKLFHGKLFHIPALTSEFLHLGNILAPFHIPLPSVSSMLKLSESAILNALHLNPLQQYVAAVPACKAALGKRNE